jgi:hypothetical protein
MAEAKAGKSDDVVVNGKRRLIDLAIIFGLGTGSGREAGVRCSDLKRFDLSQGPALHLQWEKRYGARKPTAGRGTSPGGGAATRRRGGLNYRGLRPC